MTQPVGAGGEVRLVYCLSIDLIESTMPALRMTQAEIDRFNRALVNQIEPHLEALAFEDLRVKFTGDGWLMMSPEIRDAERLCALATIMRNNFAVDMQVRTALPESRIPALRMAICSGRDIRVELWRGDHDWVGDSARRANRSAGFCFPNEVLVDAAVHSLVMRDFVCMRIEPGVRPARQQPKRIEEELPLWSLEDLRIEAAEDWDAAGAYVYALGQVGRTDDATEASMRVASRLGESIGEPAAGIAQNISRWNRLLATAPTYDAVLELAARLEQFEVRPNHDTLNTLIDRSPTYEEAERWVSVVSDQGVRPDRVSFNALIGRAPDYQTALRLLTAMRLEKVQPDNTTLHLFINRAPSFREAMELVDSFGEGTSIDVEAFRRLLARAPGYDTAVGLLEAMNRWEVDPDADIFNRLIARAPSYEDAEHWLEVMKEKAVEPDVSTFNTLISRASRYGAAVGWLELMRGGPACPDVTTYNILMARAPGYEMALNLLETMGEDGVAPNTETFKALIGQAPDYATSIDWLDRMQERGIRPNNETFKALMSRAPEYESAFSWLESMRQAGVAPNAESFRMLMSRAPDFATARGLLDTMLERGIRPNAETFKTLAASAPDYATAVDLVEVVAAAGVRPEPDTFLPVIAGAPDFATALGWLDRMRSRRVAPNSDTLTALLRRAPDYEKALELLQSQPIEPNEAAFKLMVDRSTNMETARVWVDHMRAEGMRPGVAVLSSLLSKDPGTWSGDELLRWYLTLDFHPSGPMQGAIEHFLKLGRVRDALRLALDYPHLEAARSVFRRHLIEALEYLAGVLERSPGHPNGHYAMGLALLESERAGEALIHLELARELARPGPRVAALEEIIRVARRQGQPFEPDPEGVVAPG
jgi:tetratricopeptide (TPR) repeat protein